MNAPLSPADVMPDFRSAEAKWRAVQQRDARADDQFFYSVATTGVYCRPSCAARPARRENVDFHATRAAAERAGFRACKRCRPDLPPRAERDAAVVALACRRLEAADVAVPLAALAAEASMSQGAFQRLFKQVTGVTPKAFSAAQRQRSVEAELRTADSITDAFYTAGYGSSGRFYEAAPAMLGMKPSAYRDGGAGERIGFAVRNCSLGVVLVATTERGVCAILLGDRAEVVEAELRERFPKALLEAAAPALKDTIDRVVALVDRPDDAYPLPLDIRGTAFQRRVWEVLRQIPAGETRSYAAVAQALGQPKAVRAVASAIAANALAVAIPCHRVIATNGSIAGYRWGVERKRRLLAKERG